MSSSHSTYLKENSKMPFCKGCGHILVLRRLNEALVRLQLSPSDVSLVTDIGCIGLADALFESVHTVHTTHGRSTAFATGIELADAVLAESKLKTIVLIGDGGAMIGLLHLVQAALLNVDLTVLLCNNFLFGMTGGQNSAFSPLEFVTPTTPTGNLVPPIDLCRVMMGGHAEFVGRFLATDPGLSEVITQAIRHPGFALVEIVELCTEHAVPRNKLTGSTLRQRVEAHGQQLGMLADTRQRQEFGAIYSERYPRATQEASPESEDDPLIPRYASSLQAQVGIVIAGSAGERVQSAARRLCEAAALSRLYCTQKNDNPITQGTGFSISEVILSPTEILYTGIEVPSAVVVVSNDGMKELCEQGLFDRLSPASVVILDAEVEGPPTSATLHRQAFRKDHGGSHAALKALEYYLCLSGIIPIEAFNGKE